MPKAQVHWTYDLFAVALVGGISGLVFWLVPPAEPSKAIAALGDASPAIAALFGPFNGARRHAG
jgi:hypothetical protein